LSPRDLPSVLWLPWPVASCHRPYADYSFPLTYGQYASTRPKQYIHACMFLHVYIHIALLIQGIFVAIDMLQGKYILFLINHTISNIFLIHGIRLQLSIHTCLWAWPILVETQLQHMLHLISSMNHEEIQRSKAIVTHAYHKSRGNPTAHTFIFLVATLVATTKISGATYISMNHDAILWFRSRLELS
jgi:hypothetical protein